jgi:transposase
MLSFSVFSEGNMARPKAADLCELAARAESDLNALDRGKVTDKLRAIASVSAHPYETVADIMKVTVQTLCNWVAAYRENGVDGLVPKPKKPKPSKLSSEQKAAVLSWLDAGKTAKGEEVHWTVGGLCAAVLEEFGVSIGTTAVWTWLRKEGMKPKAPRPSHCQSDAAAQAAFKKKLRS